MGGRIDDEQIATAKKEVAVMQQILEILEPFKPHTRASILWAAIELDAGRRADAKDKA